MSGTSLDGLDIALCQFTKIKKQWTFKIIKAETINYNNAWNKLFSTVHSYTATELLIAHNKYGEYLGEQCILFLKKHNLSADYISSHGHTIFHQPQNKFTFQLGNGNAIAAVTGLDVIYDFRSADVAIGGQGAPLVPIGDELLFSEYAACLNLGGIANISFKQKNKRIAYDICPFNMGANYLASKLNKVYDKDGHIASAGKLIPVLLKKMEQLSYYQKTPPKSLGREWFEKEMRFLLEQHQPTKFSNSDVNFHLSNNMHTYMMHVTNRIKYDLKHNKISSILLSGGGVFNKFAVKQLESQNHTKIIIPNNTIVAFKEALIFAFLGVLRMLNIPNCISSVTGAPYNSIGGVIVKGSCKQ